MNLQEPKTTEIIDAFVESIGNFAMSMGISKVVAQMYALLYVSPEPLSLGDMAEFLKVSKGTVCMNIKYLEQWDAAKRTWVKGSRKDYYKANLDLPGIIVKRLKEGISKRAGIFMEQLNKIELDLKKNNPSSYDGYKKKFDKIKEFNTLVNKALSIGETFLK